MAMLHTLVPAGKKRKRVGRGGDRGGTSGKGHKGQKARSGGGVSFQFEGGQMPLTRRLPKRGFSNARFKKTYEVINLGTLDKAFDAGTEVTKELLLSKGLIKKLGSLVKVLGSGLLEKGITVHADAFSKAAVTSITNAGGNVHVIKE